MPPKHATRRIDNTGDVQELKYKQTKDGVIKQTKFTPGENSQAKAINMPVKDRHGRENTHESIKHKSHVRMKKTSSRQTVQALGKDSFPHMAISADKSVDNQENEKPNVSENDHGNSLSEHSSLGRQTKTFPENIATINEFPLDFDKETDTKVDSSQADVESRPETSQSLLHDSPRNSYRDSLGSEACRDQNDEVTVDTVIEIGNEVSKMELSHTFEQQAKGNYEMFERTNSSRNTSKSFKEDKCSRNTSAASTRETSQRCKSAVHRTLPTSRNLLKSGNSQRSKSAISRTSPVLRKDLAALKTETSQKDNAVVIRSSLSLRSHFDVGKDYSENRVFCKADEETEYGFKLDTSGSDAGNVNDANRSSPRKLAPEIDSNTEKTSTEEALPLTPHSKSRDAHVMEEDRSDIHSRCSRLMLGSGKVRKENDLETLELHFDKTDYSNLVSQRASNIFCITGTTYTSFEKENKLSPRPVEVQLPKTYITRSGSLFLYSDSKIVKDKERQNSESYREQEKRIEIQGKKLSPRTLVPQAYPYWGKLVNRKKSSSTTENRTGTRRHQRDYISASSRGSPNKPYSWNYTVLPVKLVHTEEKRDIKTVSNLSEAVLAYRTRSPTIEDKYLTMMRETRDGKTLAERQNEFRAEKLQRLSTWTDEWIDSQCSSVFREKRVVNADTELESHFIARLRTSFQQSTLCRTPANTPSVGSKQHQRLAASVSHPRHGEISRTFPNVSKVNTVQTKSIVSRNN